MPNQVMNIEPYKFSFEEYVKTSGFEPDGFLSYKKYIVAVKWKDFLSSETKVQIELGDTITIRKNSGLVYLGKPPSHCVEAGVLFDLLEI